MSEQPLGNSAATTEEELELWLEGAEGALRPGVVNPLGPYPRRVIRLIAEVRRLRKENKMKTVSMAELLKWTEEQDAKIEEQAKEIERLKAGADFLHGTIDDLEEEIEEMPRS